MEYALVFLAFLQLCKQTIIQEKKKSKNKHHIAKCVQNKKSQYNVFSNPNFKNMGEKKKKIILNLQKHLED